MKLKSLIKESQNLDYRRMNIGEKENEKGMTNEEKRAFLEAVASYHQLGEMISHKGNLSEIHENIKNIVESASSLTIKETGDWFDRVTVQRHMKSMNESYKVFSNSINEVVQLQQRLESAYDEIGEVLGKYYEIKEGNEFGAERARAIAANKDSFEVDGKSFKVTGVDAEDKENAKKFANESMKLTSLLKREELKGDQHKLDVDGDGEIEASDLAALRAGGKKEESVKEGKKRFNQKNNVGSSKYVISYHDGQKKHKDGSDFFDIQIFKNQKDLETFKKALLSKGFIEESINEEIKVGQMVKVVNNPHWEAALGKKGPFKRKVKGIYGDSVFFTDGSNSDMKYVKEGVESVNEEEIKWNAVQNAIINFLKMNTKILDKRVQAKDTDGVKSGLKSIINGLTNAQRNLKLESVNEAKSLDDMMKDANRIKKELGDAQREYSKSKTETNKAKVEAKKGQLERVANAIRNARANQRESVDESHFKVGDKVKMSHGGVGIVKSLDKEDGADDEKYYNIELPNGDVMKHAPNELKLVESQTKKTSMLLKTLLKSNIYEGKKAIQADGFEINKSVNEAITLKSPTFKKLVTYLQKISDESGNDWNDLVKKLESKYARLDTYTSGANPAAYVVNFFYIIKGKDEFVKKRPQDFVKIGNWYVKPWPN
jgi:hypothetical protein